MMKFEDIKEDMVISMYNDLYIMVECAPDIDGTWYWNANLLYSDPPENCVLFEDEMNYVTEFDIDAMVADQ